MNIGVIGAGSWGTTLAVLLHENGHTVTLWSFVPADVETMRATRRNLSYMPELELPAALEVTDDISRAASGKDLLLLATPSQFLRGVLQQAAASISGDPILVNVAKGIETTTLLRMSELVADCLPASSPDRYSVLSGPSHAEEVAIGKATSVVAASVSADTVQAVQKAFMQPAFRVYGSSDVIGVELGGSLKNVIAIGAGICDGAGFGDNTKAALITRGIAEMRRLGIALGAEPHTFAGLSGLGDLIVTTMSRHSRNRHVGEEIGRGRTLAQILASMRMVAEGVDTTRSAHALALRTGAEMPITHQMYHILFDEKPPEVAVRDLMTRSARDEVW
ncbi:MAG: NAD(P)-dependent glycerol-3-phosphate dehydrogenase [Ignavibacteriae bacterium]|nr:NAD(P)-dependent glycerol-3-phosphate dehydrogenase [Ignavibacteriota bacterium]